MRDAFMERVELSSLPKGARILEVGVGTGANLPLVVRDLPTGMRAEYWGLDLAPGMLGRCRTRLPQPCLDVNLVLGDAHRLPFATASFDRVFHVGALGSFGDPAAALLEMARVAKAGAPIVVVDEQLDTTRPVFVRDRVAFKLLTFYDRDPHCPVELVPDGSTDVDHWQISRFYYCLRFRSSG